MDVLPGIGWKGALSGASRGLIGLVKRFGLRQAVFSTVCLLTLAYGSYALFLKRDGELVRARGLKPTSVLLEDNATIGQSFRAQADGLDSVELRIGRMESPLTTDFRCELLRSEGSSFRSVSRWVEPVTLPASGGPHRFTFAPVPKSRDQVFRFIIRLARPGLKVPIEASMDNAFDAGAMIVNDREEWGDLVFDTGAMASTRFGYFRMTATQLPPMLRPLTAQVAVLAVFSSAWLCLIYWLFVARDEPS